MGLVASPGGPDGHPESSAWPVRVDSLATLGGHSGQSGWPECPPLDPPVGPFEDRTGDPRKKDPEVFSAAPEADQISAPAQVSEPQVVVDSTVAAAGLPADEIPPGRTDQDTETAPVDEHWVSVTTDTCRDCRRRHALNDRHRCFSCAGLHLARVYEPVADTVPPDSTSLETAPGRFQSTVQEAAEKEREQVSATLAAFRAFEDSDMCPADARRRLNEVTFASHVSEAVWELRDHERDWLRAVLRTDSRFCVNMFLARFLRVGQASVSEQLSAALKAVRATVQP